MSFDIDEMNTRFKEVNDSIREVDDKAERGEKLVEASVTFAKVVEELRSKNAQLEDVNKKYQQTMSVNDRLYAQISDSIVPSPLKTEEQKLVDKIETKKLTASDFKSIF